jgi:hypothetical protein
VWVCAVAGAVAVGRVVGGVAAAAAHHGTLPRTNTTYDHRYEKMIAQREEEGEAQIVVGTARTHERGGSKRQAWDGI